VTEPATAPEPTRGRPDSRLAAALAALGAVAVGAAIQVREGYGAPAAFVWLTVAVVAVLLAVVLPTHRAVEVVLRPVLPALLVVALVWQLHALVHTLPARPFLLLPDWQPTMLVAAVGATVAALLVAVARGVVLRSVGVVALLAIHLALGVWTIGLQPAPAPPIDVFIFQRDGVAALLAGVNPYSITFPNPYLNGVYYGPGMVANGRLLFGFVYPPLSVFLSTAGEWVGGDVRYAQLGAMTLSGLCMATTRRGPVGGLAAALYLFTPRNLFVLEQSWTEPFVVLCLAVAVWCAARHPRLAPYALGLFLAVKQYAVLALPLALLLARPPMTLSGLRSVVVRAAAAAAAVTLPLALLDVPGFVRAVVTLQFAQPFRPEALSYLGLLAGPVAPGAPPPPPPFGTGVAFAVAAAVGGLALWRVARTPAGFALGVAALFLAFFVLNKQAFANYYFFVIGALCVAVAAADPVERPWTAGRRAQRARGDGDRRDPGPADPEPANAERADAERADPEPASAAPADGEPADREPEKA
jgi:hypothetical protein